MKLNEWQDYIPQVAFESDSVHVDLGAGDVPRNPLGVPKVIATDFHILENSKHEMVIADLTKPLPFATNSIFSMSAFDVLEHIPRWERTHENEIVFPFVRLMSEIYRCLEPGGFFIAVTPAFPSPAAFQDPTHINFVTEDTLDLYFSGVDPWSAKLGYGFVGTFNVIKNEWKSGEAVLEGTSLQMAISGNSNPKEWIRRWLRSKKILLGITRVLRGIHPVTQPTHLLWVLQKPTEPISTL